MSGRHNIWRVWARMVKIEHSVFALPFAWAGALWAARGLPSPEVLAWLTLAMVAVRSFAMTVNRMADARLDAANPRTANRPLPSGELTMAWAFVMAAVSGLVFLGAAAMLNPLVLALAPAVLAWSAGYSLAKRFTWLCHFWLGSVLGLAPVAGALAVEPAFTPAPVILGLGVTYWVAGFDLIYACQDTTFDRRFGLHAFPALHGPAAALALARLAHLTAAALFLAAGWVHGAGWIYYATVAGIGLAMLLEHRLVGPHDLDRLGTAFFTLNGVIAVALLAGIGLDTLL